MSVFKKATRKQSKLRLAIIGPSGSGKTMSALKIAAGLGGKTALIDTEHGSAGLYSDAFDFDACDLHEFDPMNYVKLIKQAEADGYDNVVIDSLSHAWAGQGGALDQVDQASKRSKSGNSYYAWRDVTPKHNALVDAIVQSKCHVIVTMRTKVEYAVDKDSNGKLTPKKIGLAPVQREGLDYEMTVVGEMDLEHNLVITKTRCSLLTDKVIKLPGSELGGMLKSWLNEGEAVQPARLALAAVPNQPEPADIPTGEPTEAEKVAARFAECQSLDDAKKLAAEANAAKAKFGVDFNNIVRPAALAAIQRLQPSAPGAA